MKLIKTDTKKCPKCGLTDDVETFFGYRIVRDRIIAQSWCKICRSRDTIERRHKEEGVKLTEDSEQVREVFKQYFGGDKTKRAWRFMVQRLMGKLGDNVKLTAEAKAKLGGDFFS